MVFLKPISTIIRGTKQNCVAKIRETKGKFFWLLNNNDRNKKRMSIKTI